jgi:hypothetical protein
MLLEKCRPQSLKGDLLRLGIEPGAFFQREQLESGEKRRIVEEAAARAFGRPVRVSFAAAGAPPRTGGSAAKSAGPGAGRAPRGSAAGAAGRAGKKPDDPAVRKLMDKFDGRVVNVRKRSK